MWKDSIVEEVRRAREEIAAEHGHDLEAIRRSFEECEARGELETVRRAPRRLVCGPIE